MKNHQLIDLSIGPKFDPDYHAWKRGIIDAANKCNMQRAILRSTRHTYESEPGEDGSVRQATPISEELEDEADEFGCKYVYKDEFGKLEGHKQNLQRSRMWKYMEKSLEGTTATQNQCERDRISAKETETLKSDDP